jgi:hypothetical protein
MFAEKRYLCVEAAQSMSFAAYGLMFCKFTALQIHGFACHFLSATTDSDGDSIRHGDGNFHRCSPIIPAKYAAICLLPFDKLISVNLAERYVYNNSLPLIYIALRISILYSFKDGH